MAVIPDKFKDLLQSKALAHVATIGPHGEPQSNPVWFGWDGEHILFSQTKKRQKYRNLLRNPYIALSIVDPNNPYRYLEVRGKVIRIDEDPNRQYTELCVKAESGILNWHSVVSQKNQEDTHDSRVRQ
jgi:PPOX class probable F420-dependent enzyme